MLWMSDVTDDALAVDDEDGALLVPEPRSTPYCTAT